MSVFFERNLSGQCMSCLQYMIASALTENYHVVRSVRRRNVGLLFSENAKRCEKFWHFKEKGRWRRKDMLGRRQQLLSYFTERDLLWAHCWAWHLANTISRPYYSEYFWWQFRKERVATSNQRSLENWYTISNRLPPLTQKWFPARNFIKEDGCLSATF